MDEQDAPGFEGKVWRLKPAPTQSAEKQLAPALARIEQPSWLKLPAPPSIPLTRVIAPSRAMADAVLERTRSAPAAGLDPLRRGKLVHALLHALVPIPPSERMTRAKRFLADAADVTEEDRNALAAEAIAVLGHADCAMLFSENSRGEVPIFASRLIESGPIEIAGRIDRLAETEDAVHIADFKTDRKLPMPNEERFSAYVGQLALYREALRHLYPGKAVRAHLVWTVKPTIQEISADALDAAFQRAIRDLGTP
jgi:ATP-dependent helicase/nuclease subunit A